MGGVSQGEDAATQVRAGLLAALPVIASVIPYALVLGANAAKKGLSPLEMWVMSASVFAGGAQFVAIELWQDPVVWSSVVLATFIINLRHVLMGASFSRYVGRYPPWRRRAAFFFMVDESWALVMQHAAEHGFSGWFYAAISAALFVTWTSATTAGVVFGAALEDPARYGFDFAFTAIFLCLIVGFWAGPKRSLPPWTVAAGAAVAGYLLLPGVWYVLLGGLAGAAVGAFQGQGSR